MHQNLNSVEKGAVGRGDGKNGCITTRTILMFDHFRHRILIKIGFFVCHFLS